MEAFHVTVHSAPSTASAGPPVVVDGGLYVPVAVTAADLPAHMGLTFEQADARLRSIPRLFLEPDGSFVWRHRRDDHDWQVDGNLFDGPERLSFVELKGSADDAMLGRLLRCLDAPEKSLIFYLSRHGLFLDEAEFRRYACR